MVNADLARYRAFISYSHKDEAWAKWLHGQLETYRVPRRLVGRDTPAGAIPRRLFPVFKDRDELPSSAKLAASITEALEQSLFQIVICSPHAASSRWVNEEIKIFKRLGRDDRILALVVDGTPDATDTPGSGLPECFPPALRYRLADHGELSSQKAEVAAADVRKGKDGRHNAKLKLIAGLIGVGLDELKQRERTRQRWRYAIRTAIVCATLVVVSALLRAQQQSHAEQQQQQRVARLVEYGRKELDAGESARAATYLSAAYSAGDSSVDIRYLLGRALPSVEALEASALRNTPGFYATQIAYTPDGSGLVVVEHRDQPPATIGRVVSASDGSLRATLGDCPDQAWAFSADGTRVLLTGHGASDGRPVTRVFDLATGRRLLDAPGQSDVWRTAGAAIEPPPSSDPRMERVVTLDADGYPMLWQIAPDGSPVSRRLIDVQAVSVGFSQDGSRIVVGGNDGTIRTLDVGSGHVLRTFQVKPPKPTAAFFVGELIATLSDSGAVNLWDAATASWQGTLSGHGSKVIKARIAADGRELVTAAANEPVRVWDVRDQRTVFVSPQKQDAYAAFELTDDARHLVAITSDAHAAVVFSTQTGAQVATFDGHLSPIVAGGLNRHATEMMTASYDGVVRRWNWAKLAPALVQLFSHDAVADNSGGLGIRWAGFTDPGHLVSAGTDGTVRAWTEGRDQPLQVQRSRGGAIESLVLSGDRHRVLTGESAGIAQLWSLDQPAPIAELAGGHAHPIKRVALSNDGTIAATLDFLVPIVNLWDTRSGQLRVALKGHDQLIISLQFFADGRRLVTSSYDGTARIWDATTGQSLFVLRGHGDRVLAATPSPDGATVVTAGADRKAMLWSASDGKPLRTLDVADSGQLDSVVFTRDSRRVAIGADDGAVLIWDLSTGESRKLSGLHPGYSDVLAFSPDESLIASPRLGGGDLGLWAVDSGRLLMQWNDPDRSFYTASFSPDGKRLVAAGFTSGSTADFPVFDVSLETRTPEQIAAIIRCKSPWKVDGERLLPHAPEAPNCPGLVEAQR